MGSIWFDYIDISCSRMWSWWSFKWESQARRSQNSFRREWQRIVSGQAWHGGFSNSPKKSNLSCNFTILGGSFLLSQRSQQHLSLPSIGTSQKSQSQFHGQLTSWHIFNHLLNRKCCWDATHWGWVSKITDISDLEMNKPSRNRAVSKERDMVIFLLGGFLTGWYFCISKTMSHGKTIASHMGISAPWRESFSCPTSYTFRPLRQLPLAHVEKNNLLIFELLSYISSQDIHFWNFCKNAIVSNVFWYFLDFSIWNDAGSNRFQPPLAPSSPHNLAQKS